MFYFLRFALTVLMISTMPVVSPVYAYGGDGPDETEIRPPGGAGLSNSVTNRVVRLLKSKFEGCRKFETVYRYDCYRQTYRSAAASLEGKKAYADAYEALRDVEKSLDQIMARSADPQKPKIRKGLQTYQPIKPAAAPKAKADLNRALDQAETKLLRAPDSARTHYARIAEAVNSNKVLLRSRLYPDGIYMVQTAFA